MRLRREMLTVGLVGLLAGALTAAAGDDTINLAGDWGVRLDSSSIGEQEAWWQQSFSKFCKLPGSLTENGYGEPVGVDTRWSMPEDYITLIKRTAQWCLDSGETDRFLVTTWMNPGRYYVGKAWYQKKVELPASQTGRYRLHLERTHWITTLWVGDKKIGSRDSLYTPHEYEFEASGTVWVTLCVDNSRNPALPIGLPAHGLSDHTQGMWNGVVGELTLKALPQVQLGEAQWKPSFADKTLQVKALLKGVTDADGVEAELSLVEHQGGRQISLQSINLAKGLNKEGSFAHTFVLPQEVKPWDEFTPTLYHATLRLKREKKIVAESSQRIGFRDVSQGKGNRLLLNGTPLFVRSTLDCGIFPLTGYPSTDVAEWRRIFKQVKAYGCNAVRCHSYTPPEAAFEAADEIGIYLQPEMCWANAGGGHPIDQWLLDEGRRILEAFGDHPSFIFFACGNEMGGPNGGRTIKYPPFFDIPGKRETFDSHLSQMRGAQYLSRWVPAMEELTKLQFITGSAGWPYINEAAFHMHHTPLRLKDIHEFWGPRSDWDYSSVVAAYNRPLVSHESGQWAAFPSLDIRDKFKGVLKQDFLDIVAIRLKVSGLYDQHRAFTYATGKTQALFYKEEIEALRRTPGVAGYQLLALQEFTGQRTAVCGVLDPFMDDKGYTTADYFAAFNAPTVPLAMMAKRVWTNDETLKAVVRVAHNGPKELPPQKWKWTLSSQQALLASGEFTGGLIHVGDVAELGEIRASLGAVKKAMKLQLRVSLEDGRFANEWNVWVYPKTLPETASDAVLVSRALDKQAHAVLAKGGTVIFSPGSDQMKGARVSKFEPIFWLSAGEPAGLLIQDKHPALADFPTDVYKDLQWWEPIKHATVIALKTLPPELKPIIQVVDNAHSCQKLGYVFEAKVGGGKLIFSAIDLIDTIEGRPVSRQLRQSLVAYAGSDTFRPTVALTFDQLKSIASFEVSKQKSPSTKFGKTGMSAKASSETVEHPAGNLLDGDSNTFWHTPWEGDAPGFPHQVTLLLKEPVQIEGVELIPREKEARNLPKTIEIYTTVSGNDWGSPVLTVKFNNKAEPQTFRFPIANTVKGIRLRILDSHGRGRWTSLAEVIPISQFGEQAGEEE